MENQSGVNLAKVLKCDIIWSLLPKPIGSVMILIILKGWADLSTDSVLGKWNPIKTWFIFVTGSTWSWLERAAQHLPGFSERKRALYRPSKQTPNTAMHSLTYTRAWYTLTERYQFCITRAKLMEFYGFKFVVSANDRRNDYDRSFSGLIWP